MILTKFYYITITLHYITITLHYITITLRYITITLHIRLNITFFLSCKVVNNVSGNRPLLLTLLHVTVKFDLSPPTRIYGFF